MSTFLKKGELQLKNGGYLSDTEGKPVDNPLFVELQRQAEFIVEFSKAVVGKDFKGKTPDSLESIKKEVLDKLNSAKKVEFFTKPEAVARPLNEQLTAEALSFDKYHKDLEETEKLNNFMQRFNLLADFEQHGLFFTSGIVKLNRIYTVSEIKEALKSTINYL